MAEMGYDESEQGYGVRKFVVEGTKRIVEVLGLDDNRIVVSVRSAIDRLRFSKEPSKHIMEEPKPRSTSRWEE